jgi:hypothetical protein
MTIISILLDYYKSMNLLQSQNSDAGFESRIQHVLRNDEIVQALKNDPTSTEFISQRVKEVIEEIIVSDKDKQIQGIISIYRLELLNEVGILKQEVHKYDKRLTEIKGKSAH